MGRRTNGLPVEAEGLGVSKSGVERGRRAVARRKSGFGDREGAAIAPAAASFGVDRRRDARSPCARPEFSRLARHALGKLRAFPGWRGAADDQRRSARSAALGLSPGLPRHHLWRRHLGGRACQCPAVRRARVDAVAGAHGSPAGAGPGKPDRHVRRRNARPGGGTAAQGKGLRARPFSAILGIVHRRRLGRQPFVGSAVAALWPHRADVRRSAHRNAARDDDDTRLSRFGGGAGPAGNHPGQRRPHRRDHRGQAPRHAIARARIVSCRLRARLAGRRETGQTVGASQDIIVDDAPFQPEGNLVASGAGRRSSTVRPLRWRHRPDGLQGGETLHVHLRRDRRRSASPPSPERSAQRVARGGRLGARQRLHGQDLAAFPFSLALLPQRTVGARLFRRHVRNLDQLEQSDGRDERDGAGRQTRQPGRAGAGVFAFVEHVRPGVQHLHDLYLQERR